MDFEKLGTVVVEGPLWELVNFLLDQPELWDPAVDMMNNGSIIVDDFCFDGLTPSLIDEIAEINRQVGPVLYIHNDNVDSTLVFVGPKSFKTHDEKDTRFFFFAREDKKGKAILIAQAKRLKKNGRISDYHLEKTGTKPEFYDLWVIPCDKWSNLPGDSG